MSNTQVAYYDNTLLFITEFKSIADELEQFKADYPDIYDVVESISHLQADRRVEDIETRLTDLRNQEVELTKQKCF